MKIWKLKAYLDREPEMKEMSKGKSHFDGSEPHGNYWSYK